MTVVLVATLGIYSAFLLWFSHRRFGPVFSSPVQIAGGGLLTLAVLGWIFYGTVAGTRGAAGIKIYLTDAQRDESFVLILQFTVAMLAGAVVASLVMKRSEIVSDAVSMRALEIPDRAIRLALLLTPVPLALIVWAQGRNLWDRPVYIDHLGGNIVASSASSVGIGAVAVLGYLWGKRQARLYVLAVTLGYAVVFFGAGSRRLALIPVLFALGAMVASPTKWARVGLLFAGASALYLLYLPLAMRAGSSHGIAPYWSRLPEVLSDGSSFAVTALNLLVGFAIIHRTAYGAAPIPASDMWVSINPLPGGLAGWQEIVFDHRLNLYTPYAGVGEVGNAGGWWIVGLGMAIGALLSVLDKRVDVHLAKGQHAVALIVVGLSAVFLLFMTQYTLRSSMRMLFYALALSLATSWWGNRRRHPASSRGKAGGRVAGQAVGVTRSA
jgi:hypothetical protein